MPRSLRSLAITYFLQNRLVFGFQVFGDSVRAFAGGKFEAGNFDAKEDRFGFEAEFGEDCVFSCADLGVIELKDFPAVGADDVIVIGAGDVVEVVAFGAGFFVEGKFVEESRFDEDGERAVNGRPRDGAVGFAGAGEEFLRGVVGRGSEGFFDDNFALGGEVRADTR